MTVIIKFTEDWAVKHECYEADYLAIEEEEVFIDAANFDERLTLDLNLIEQIIVNTTCVYFAPKGGGEEEDDGWI